MDKLFDFQCLLFLIFFQNKQQNYYLHNKNVFLHLGTYLKRKEKKNLFQYFRTRTLEEQLNAHSGMRFDKFTFKYIKKKNFFLDYLPSII